MIVAPNKMNFADKNIIMIISGMPGVGKTTLACSAPDVLLIDTDEGMCRVKPEHRKDASICKTYEEILADCRAAVGHYKTIVIDTAGALIESMKDWAMRTDPKASKTNGGFSQQGFGIIKQEFLRLSNDLRKNFNVIYLFHEQIDKLNEDVFYSLVCEGSAKVIVWQPADIGAHLFVQNGERYLGFTPTEQYSAKSAYGIKGLVKIPELKDGDKNDFLTKLFAQIKTNLYEESKSFSAEKEQYEDAMKAGKTFVETINKPEDVKEALSAINEIEHALTSKAEITAMVKARLAELGIVYNKTTKAYELKAE